MTTIRDVRRSVERGELDEAMVALWNLLEPLRLRGDVEGLRRVSDLADEIAGRDGGSHALDAARLQAAADELISAGRGVAEPAVGHVSVGERGAEVGAGPVDDDFELPEAVPVDDDEESAGRRLGPLVWALLVGLFLLLNVLGNVFGDG